MSNVKISALPPYSASVDTDVVFVVNNSGETETFKIELKEFAGMMNVNGNNSIQSNSWLTNLGTTAQTQSAIAIGNGAEATSPYSIAIGYQALNANRDGTRNNYICIGTNAQAVQESFALGTNARAFGASTCSIGDGAETYGNSALALGRSSYSASSGGVALGYNSSDTSNNYGFALGSETSNSADYGVSLGYASTNISEKGIAIGWEADNKSAFGITFGGSGNTIHNISGTSISLINSFNADIYGPSTFSGLYGCTNTDIDIFGGSGLDYCLGFGLSGRTLTQDRYSHFENVKVFGQIEQEPVIFPGSNTTVDVDITQTGIIELTATGGTYNIDIDPTTSKLGLELTLMIHYFSAATINFVSGGNTQWKFGNNEGAPVFSGNNNYNILVFRSWDGNDLYEQSRSLYMS